MNTPHLPKEHEVKHVVCLLLGEIGDALVCTPTLQALRVHYPCARLTLIARPPVVAMLSPGGLVDAFVVFGGTHALGRLAFFWRLWQLRCDLWVDLQAPTFNTFGTDGRIFQRNTLLRRIARSRYQRVFSAPGARDKVSHPVPVPVRAVLETENMVDTTLRLMGPVPVSVSSRAKHLGVSAAAQTWAKDWWTAAQLDSATVLGLFFGSKQPAKFWPQERVQALLTQWLDAHAHHQVVILGAAHEEALTRGLLQRLPVAHVARVKSAVGVCSLTQTAALMQRCDVMVCTDSGPMHMADALQRPMVALMSHHNHQGLWAPISPGATVIAKQVPCGPCFKDVCDKDNACMARITAEEVMCEVMQKIRDKAR
ncbi:RfaF ADP-heptose,LPS heptosyltransferase [Comamonadaceae bacterium]